ncbi:MAG: cytochrome c oxidase assembly protein, partial [Pseudomonadota bacterium]
MSKPNLAKKAIPFVGIAFGMLGMAYAAVPLYDLFCRVTGFGGTTQT